MSKTVARRIREFNEDRLPDMVALKYKRMTDNMFRFFRGSCHLFYEDLAADNTLPPSPPVWICGDLHLENFGSYKGDNRLVYFDLNDFDEAVLAPAALEISRIVTSILIAFDVLKIDEARALNMAKLFLKSYSCCLAKGKAYYIDPKTSRGIVSTFLTAISKRKQSELLDKRTQKRKEEIRLVVDNIKHLELDKFLRRELFHHIHQWLMHDSEGPFNYQVTDAVFRVAGTGSIGLKRYEFLLKSTNSEGSKYMLVDMKQAAPSSLMPYIDIAQPTWESEAHRIVSVQQRMQSIPPALLSTTNFRGEDFIIQEMQPVKDSINFNLIKDRYRDIYQVIDDMAMLTASSQLRSSGRQGSATADELIAFGQDNQWQDAILAYAARYEHKTRKNYADFLKQYDKNGLK
jgi:uncharacterized protein (DUF2252 family)